jgi:radical SAM superfamily enzyme YgiQ (UPF0313 family)
MVMGRVLDDLRRGEIRGIYKADRLHPMVGMPMPRYDLVKQNRYVNRTFIQTSRGCHQACTFCAEPLMNGLRFRYRPVDEVMREVEACGQRHISINDADFFGTPERPKAVMRALKGRGIQREHRLRHVRLFGADALSGHLDLVPDAQGRPDRVL